MSALVNVFVPEMNTSITQMNATQAATDTDAATATSSAVSANAAANTVSATAKAVAWVSGNTYQLTDCAISQINFQTYRKKTTSTANTGGATDPANDSTNWVSLNPNTQMVRVVRTSNTALALADTQKFFDLSTTFTQTFNAASTLGGGWYCILRNSGTGYITLDPNASELIDGVTTITMMPGEVRIIQCDGTAFTSLLINTEGYFYAREEQASGISSVDTSAGGVTFTRTLNTVKANTMNASLSSNVITLQPGTYRCKIKAPAGATQHQAFLLNSTDSVNALIGSAEGSTNSVSSFVSGIFTITSQKNFAVRHYTGSNGLVMGTGISSGQVQVFTEIELWKIA
jgi:hypothetical protein